MVSNRYFTLLLRVYLSSGKMSRTGAQKEGQTEEPGRDMHAQMYKGRASRQTEASILYLISKDSVKDSVQICASLLGECFFSKVEKKKNCMQVILHLVEVLQQTVNQILQHLPLLDALI